MSKENFNDTRHLFGEGVKMLRQAIQVSPSQLRRLADELEKENEEFFKAIGVKIRSTKRYLIPIINKQSKCSDTWRFEELK